MRAINLHGILPGGSRCTCIVNGIQSRLQFLYFVQMGMFYRVLMRDMAGFAFMIVLLWYMTKERMLMYNVCGIRTVRSVVLSSTDKQVNYFNRALIRCLKLYNLILPINLGAKCRVRYAKRNMTTYVLADGTRILLNYRVLLWKSCSFIVV